MVLSIGDGICIVDSGGIVVWANQPFIDIVSHRAKVIGSSFSQLFPGEPDPCRRGVVIEDRDKQGRKRYFKAECSRQYNEKGHVVSDIVMLRNVTLKRTIIDISRYSTQTSSVKDLLDKVLALIRDVYGYSAVAGFVAREGSVELVSSKGWTQKLKSLIGTQAIAPDSIGMAGRSAYHRKQMITATKNYSLLPDVKAAIEKIGGEYIVVTPLIDHDRLVGVLTVIHNKALGEADFDTLQSLCNQIAIALDVRLIDEDAALKSEEASLFIDLMAYVNEYLNLMAGHYASLTKNASPAEVSKYIDEISRHIKRSEDVISIVKRIAEKGETSETRMALNDIVRGAIATVQEYADVKGVKASFKYTPIDGAYITAGPLFRFAVYETLHNAVKHAAGPTVDVDIKVTKDRTGTYRLEISDNGPGIPDEIKSEVFRKQKEMLPDAGTGLYMVKRIVNRYGGRVWIEDRVPGNRSRGARVVITMAPGMVKR